MKNDLFNCTRYTKRLVNTKDERREITIEKPYVCVHTTITPEVLKENINKETAEGGYFGRHLIVTGAINPRPRGRLPEKVIDIKQSLVEQINFIKNLGKDNCYFEPSDLALKYFSDVVEFECLSQDLMAASSCNGRYQNYVMSFADLLLVNEALGLMTSKCIPDSSISELVQLIQLVELVETISSRPKTNAINGTNCTNFANKTAFVVQRKHVAEAWRIIKPCLKAACEIVSYVDMGKALARVMEIVKKPYPNAISHSDALRRSNLSAKDFLLAIYTLEERGDIRKKRVPIAKGVGGSVEDFRIEYLWIGKW